MVIIKSFKFRPSFFFLDPFLSVFLLLAIISSYLPVNIIWQLTGDISHLKIGVLKEGFGRPSSEADVDALVRSAADHLGRQSKAAVAEVSVKMHLDGNVGHLCNLY